jgi:hypothetical protein
MATSVVAVEL